MTKGRPFGRVGSVFQLPLGLAFAALGAYGCATNSVDDSGSLGSGGAATIAAQSSSASTGQGGAASLCTEDCSTIQSPACLKAVCNDGSHLGTVGSCVVVPDDGADCDDGLFCTVKDKCFDGKCQGGLQNDCGMTPPECTALTCNETSQTCTPVQKDDGAVCTPSADLCQVNATCKAGVCKGVAKDCSFSPNSECNTLACNPATGNCDATPDTSKNGNVCNLSGDLCQSGKTCMAGACQGGSAKDCSAFDGPCVLGTCSAIDGNCNPVPIAPGGMCAQSTNDCNIGICSTLGTCDPMPVADNTTCNDHNACTSGDFCTAGTCGGMAVLGCHVYYVESFETCPASWTFGGDFKCGAATTITPPAAAGAQVIGTGLTVDYQNNDSFATTTAVSPLIDLTGATDPRLVFSLFLQSDEFGDGGNLSVSQDGGPYQIVGSGPLCTVANSCTAVANTKDYEQLLGAQPTWAGDEETLGFQRVTMDLTSFVGHHVQFKFAFHSDSFFAEAGFFVDSVTVSEANAIPLGITTATLNNANVTVPYFANLTKVGGTSNSVWSIASGTNDSWLTIDPATGVLTGTPTVANIGPVTITIHIEEPTLPSNHDDQTYTFNVGPAPIYAQGFEGACPDGWTLTGEWQCGTPTVVGPPAAHGGTQCIGTVLNGNYSNGDDYATTTATAPAIVLPPATNPHATFYVWKDSEGSTYDGFNLSVSTDGGATYTLLTSVTPPYTLTIDSQQAWGGHELDWAFYDADLSAFAGQTVRLRFSFRSDTSLSFAGIYIDDLQVAN